MFLYARMRTCMRTCMTAVLFRLVCYMRESVPVTVVGCVFIGECACCNDMIRKWGHEVALYATIWAWPL